MKSFKDHISEAWKKKYRNESKPGAGRNGTKGPKAGRIEQSIPNFERDLEDIGFTWRGNTYDANMVTTTYWCITKRKADAQNAIDQFNSMLPHYDSLEIIFDVETRIEKTEQDGGKHFIAILDVITYK